MTEQPQKSVSTALLERIAAATEANAQALQLLAVEAGKTRALLADTLAELARQAEHAAQAPAASAPAASNGHAPQAGGNVVEFVAEEIIVTINESGEPGYKAKGFPYLKYGVKVWPEVLPTLGLDAAALKGGKNPFGKSVRAVLNEEGKPKKVIGLAAN